MSSRSQTKSLDRDIQSRQKPKPTYPSNIQQVNNSAEHLICNFHNRIESIFELYPINRFEQELVADKITEFLSVVSNKINLDSTALLKLSQSIKAKYPGNIFTDPYELILTYLDFVLSCTSLFHGISNKLAHSIVNGLLRYCISLAPLCNSDIDFVINYEKIIQKNEDDIIREIKDTEYQNKEFKRITNSSRSVLERVVDLVSCVRKIRASINKLYYLVTEWVDEERSYPLNLSDEMRLVKSELFEVEERATKNDLSIKRRQTKMKCLEKQLKTLQKNHLILKRKLNRVKHSQDQISCRLDELENQTTSRDDELKSLKNKIKFLERAKNKPEKKIKILHYRVSMEIRVTKSDKRDVEAKNLRFQDNKEALNRHRERLSKVAEQLREKIRNSKSQISDNELATMKLKDNLNRDIQCQQKDIENLKQLQAKLKDLNFISMKKSSPDTLRQLHNHRRLADNSKDASLTDKLCDLVSKRVLDNWKQLYIHLPMYPNRTLEQRCHDINIIDTISARNDSPPVKQAKMCLDKWRLFYHNATPEHLIEGLQKSNNVEIANELKNETVRSKQRFEE